MNNKIAEHADPQVLICSSVAAPADALFQYVDKPQFAVLDSPGDKRMSPSPLRNAFGAQVIGSTPSPVRRCGGGWVCEVYSSMNG